MSWKIVALALSGLSFGFALPSDRSSIRLEDKRDDSTIQLTDGCSKYNSYWAPVHAVGGDSGDDQCETHFGTDFSPVTQIEVWLKASGDKIAGIQLTYATGEQSPTYGTPDSSKYQSNVLKTSPGETFTNCVLYGDGQGHYLGHIHLETSAGQKFDTGATTDGRTPYQSQTGSGIMTGMQISTGGDGNSVIYYAPLFLEQAIDHVAVGNISYANSPVGSNTGIQPNSLFGGEWYNNLNVNATYGLTQDYNVERSYTFTQATTSTFKLSENVEFSGEVLGFGAKESTDIGWELSTTNEQASTTATAQKVTCSAAGSLLPNTGANVTGTYQSGNGNFKYSSDVTVFLKDGTTYNYAENGQLNSVDYSQCLVTTNKAVSAGTQNTNPLNPSP